MMRPIAHDSLDLVHGGGDDDGGGYIMDPGYEGGSDYGSGGGGSGEDPMISTRMHDNPDFGQTGTFDDSIVPRYDVSLVRSRGFDAFPEPRYSAGERSMSLELEGLSAQTSRGLEESAIAEAERWLRADPSLARVDLSANGADQNGVNWRLDGGWSRTNMITSGPRDYSYGPSLYPGRR